MSLELLFPPVGEADIRSKFIDLLSLRAAG